MMWERSTNINLKIVAFLSPRHSFCQKLCMTNGQRGANCGGILEPQRTKFNVSYCSTLKHVYEEAEEIEVWSPSYPRSLQTVWIGSNEQSVEQIRIYYSKQITEIHSSTHRAPWTRARMWTIQGHEAFENKCSRTWWTGTSNSQAFVACYYSRLCLQTASLDWMRIYTRMCSIQGEYTQDCACKLPHRKPAMANRGCSAVTLSKFLHMQHKYSFVFDTHGLR